jgi:hypothetical protein
LALDMIAMTIGMQAARSDPGFLDEAADALLARPIPWASDEDRPRLEAAQVHAAKVLQDIAQGIRGAESIANLIRMPAQGDVQ